MPLANKYQAEYDFKFIEKVLGYVGDYLQKH